MFHKNYLEFHFEFQMGALFNLLRLYLVWWIFTDWMLRDLPNRHTVAHFAKVQTPSNQIAMDCNRTGC